MEVSTCDATSGARRRGIACDGLHVDLTPPGATWTEARRESSVRITHLLTALSISAAAASGQQTPLRGNLSEGAPQFAFGLGAAVPLGQFSRFVGVGGQLEGSLLFNPSKRRDLVAVRVDVTYVIYGSETRTVPLLPSTQRILVDVTTSNNIVSVGLGPQITFPGRAVRPYIGGNLGFSYFFTESAASGSSDLGTPFASTTNFDDFTFALGGLAGMYISLSSRKAISLDISVRYQHNATVRYLHEGSIQEQPDGSIRFTPTETPVDLLLLRIGIGLGSRR